MLMTLTAILILVSSPLPNTIQTVGEWAMRGFSRISDREKLEKSRRSKSHVQASNEVGRGSNETFVRYHDDGSQDAPNCGAKFSTILNEYVSRPPWKVAGVDYCVGVPGDIKLKDPATIVDNTTIPGVHKLVLRGRNYLVVDGNNVVIDGYDFSLHDGWQVDVIGNNATIKNSKFLAQSSSSLPIYFEVSAGGGSVLNCNLDGNNGAKDADGGPLLRIMGADSGRFVVKYNFFSEPYADMINLGNDSSGATQSFDIRFNVFQNAGMGTDLQGHPDYIQSFWKKASSVIVNFNTLFQSVAPAQGGSQGLGISSEVVGAVQRNVDVSNNTLIALPFDLTRTGREGVYPGISLARGQIDGTATVSNNYVDLRGFVSVNGSPTRWLLIIPPGKGGNLSGKVDCFENYNMVTGRILPC
jgi:hypothetical protein